MNGENKEEKLFGLVEDMVSDMKKTTGDNYDYSEIAKYIANSFHMELTNEAWECARYIVLVGNYTKEEILAHQADKQIMNYFGLQKAKNNSVESNPENLQKAPSARGTPLRAKREKTPKEKFKDRLKIAVLIAGIGTLAGLYMARDNFQDGLMSREIGKFASSGQSTESIVEQATESLGYNQAVGHVVTDYREDLIAGYTAQLLEKDPTTLDDVLHSIYCDLEENRLYNMDTILARLRLEATNNANLSYVKEIIDDCHSFLDYVVNKSGRVKDLCTEEVKAAVAKYNAINSMSNPNAFYNLSTNEQDILIELMNAYRDSKSISYNESLKSIQNMNYEGSRGL